jgi:hypothetical protein
MMVLPRTTFVPGVLVLLSLVHFSEAQASEVRERNSFSLSHRRNINAIRRKTLVVVEQLHGALANAQANSKKKKCISNSRSSCFLCAVGVGRHRDFSCSF